MGKIYICKSLWKLRSRKDFWMYEVRQNFQAVNDSWSWTAEIIRSIGSINAAVLNRWQFLNSIEFQKHVGFLYDLRQFIAATGEDHDLRSKFKDPVPFDSVGG